MTTYVKDQALLKSKEIFSADLVEILTNDPRWDQLVDEVLRQYRPFRSLVRWAEGRAEDMGLTILDDYQLEEDLYYAYECTEKGLS